MSDAVTALQQVRADIARACKDAGRDPASVTLVAVSKTFAADAIEPVIAAGQRVFGENRVQEAKAKWPALLEKHPDIALHLIGPLQSNKAKEAVALFDAIHSVDRMDRVEQRDRFLRLVGLQRPDQVQRDPVMGGAQRRPFRLRLLHAVLAEHALAGRNHRLDRLRPEGLRDRDQRHRRRLARGVAAGRHDLGLHPREGLRAILVRQGFVHHSSLWAYYYLVIGLRQSPISGCV